MLRFLPALALLPAAALAHDQAAQPAAKPTEAQQATLYAVGPVSPAVDRMRTRMWMRVKTGR